MKTWDSIVALVEEACCWHQGSKIASRKLFFEQAEVVRAAGCSRAEHAVDEAIVLLMRFLRMCELILNQEGVEASYPGQYKKMKRDFYEIGKLVGQLLDKIRAHYSSLDQRLSSTTTLSMSPSNRSRSRSRSCATSRQSVGSRLPSVIEHDDNPVHLGPLGLELLQHAFGTRATSVVSEGSTTPARTSTRTTPALLGSVEFGHAGGVGGEATPSPTESDTKGIRLIDRLIQASIDADAAHDCAPLDCDLVMDSSGSKTGELPPLPEVLPKGQECRRWLRRPRFGRANREAKLREQLTVQGTPPSSGSRRLSIVSMYNAIPTIPDLGIVSSIQTIPDMGIVSSGMQLRGNLQRSRNARLERLAANRAKAP